MENSGVSLCFSCGLAVGEPPRLNRLESGEFCEACQARVLDALPALLPGTGEVNPVLAKDEVEDPAEEAVDEIESALIQSSAEPACEPEADDEAHRA